MPINLTIDRIAARHVGQAHVAAEIACYHTGDVRGHALINTWFPGSSSLSTPNGMSIGLAVFAGLTNMTSGQTHRRAKGR